MIVCRRARGRLGNQLFQVAHVVTVLRAGERAWINDIGDFDRYFERPGRVFAYRAARHPRKRMAKIAWWLLRWGARARLWSRRWERSNRPRGRAALGETRGMLSLRFIDGGYWQDDMLVSRQALCGLRLRPEVVQRGRRWVSSGGGDGRPAVFVHVRRGDYLTFRGGIALPVAYYESAMRHVEEALGPCRYLFCSDDPAYLRDNLPVRPGIDAIVEDDPGATLAAMLACDAGVISNSSFSWWAGCVISCRGGGPIVGPRFLLGWQEREWEPAGLASPAFHWLDGPGWECGTCAGTGQGDRAAGVLPSRRR